MGIAVPEGLRRSQEKLKIDQDFFVFDPMVTQAREITGLHGFSSQHALREQGISLLFGFNAMETYLYDFVESDFIEKQRVSGIDVPPPTTKMDLTVVSHSRTKGKRREEIAEWLKNLYLQISIPGFSPVYEAGFGFSKDGSGRMLRSGPFRMVEHQKGYELERYLVNDFEWMAMFSGRFVKHHPRRRS